MRGKIALVNLIVGYVLHVVDVGSDVYVAIQYCIRSEWWWFSLTLVFTVLPLLAENFSLCFSPLRSLFIVSISYKDAIRKWKEENWDCNENVENVECNRDLAETRYNETIAESAPQWCLQTYVMLRQWFFPYYTILSTLLSFLSLAWSITMFERAEKQYEWYVTKKEIKSYHAVWLHDVLSFAWQLCGLLSRLPALVIFAYVFRYYVFIVLVLHWMVLILVTYHFQKDDMDVRRNCFVVQFGRLLYSTCISYPLMFHISENASKLILGEDCKHRSWAIILYHILLSLENIVLVSLAVWAAPASVTHVEDLEKIVLSVVFLGLVAATMFIIMHHHYRRPSDLAQKGQGTTKWYYNNEELQNHTGNENPVATSSV